MKGSQIIQSVLGGTVCRGAGFPRSKIMSTAKATVRVLSIIVSALSAVSFVQALFEIGLVSALGEIITYYRAISASLLGLPMAPFGMTPPQAVVDIWALSFIGAGAYVRTQGIERSRALRRFQLEALSTSWKVGLLIVFGYSGLGVAVILGAVHPLTYVDGFHEEPQDLIKGAARNILWVCAVAIAFFALNAYAPGR